MVEAAENKPLLDHFADLEDPRTRPSRYALPEILLVAICAVLSGADGWASVAWWGQAHLPWLRKILPFENGVPAHDTFGRVFGLLDAARFEARFIAWMGTVCPALEGAVALDGKTVRGSKAAGGKALHLVSAYAHERGLMLGQVKTAAKSNEVTAIPELLDALLLKGCLVTIDAMGCHKAIAAKIVGQQADYLLRVKNNQPTLAGTLERFFETADGRDWADTPHTRAEWIDKGHGRIETRRCVAAELPEGLLDPTAWAGVRSVVRIDATREVRGKVSRERCYYISSAPAEAARLGEAARGHWSIENGLHWSLDVTFGEDRARMREGNSAENFAILRRIALNLLRQDKTTQASLKNRRLLAGWDVNYLGKILGIQALA
jgi:predicted transposase YbfD/YdcC